MSFVIFVEWWNRMLIQYGWRRAAPAHHDWWAPWWHATWHGGDDHNTGYNQQWDHSGNEREAVTTTYHGQPAPSFSTPEFCWLHRVTGFANATGSGSWFARGAAADGLEEVLESAGTAAIFLQQNNQWVALGNATVICRKWYEQSFFNHRLAATVAKWLRPLMFSALNCSSSHPCGFEPSSGHVGQAKFCLRVVRCFFSGDLQFSPHLTIDGSKWVK